MADLPHGAVTFLFTDIEGSTALVKQLRDRYEEVLVEHRRLMRDTFANHAGHEIDTQGDSFFVAFARARDAVLAALEAQRALAGHEWPDGAAVRVRMGIHTGQASPTEGRYTGIAVHRAARIGAAGHGGQVLVSQATQTLLEDEEEDLGFTLGDLGPQRLKDLDRPVHLYQLAAPGLSAEFPPLKGVEDADASPAEAPRPFARRRRVQFVAVALLAVVAASVAAVLLTGGGGGGLSVVHPNNVGVIDSKTNEIVDEVPVGIRPGPIAAGAGSIWVGNVGDRNLTRIDPLKRASAGAVSLNNQTPTGLAVGAGAVWVAHGVLGKLSRVDPGTGLLTKTIDVALPSLSGEVTVGGGSVWTVNGESTLARVAPVSPRVLEQGLAGQRPTAIAYAAGSLWVANGGDQNVYRYNPTTFSAGAAGTPISVGDGPTALAFGDGGIWVANNGDDSVTRIDVISYAASTIPDVGHGPVAIAFGADAVWVASGDGTVSRIDPGTRRAVKTITVGNVPSGIVVAEGLVWVTVQAP